MLFSISKKWGMLGRTSALGQVSTSITHSLIKRAIESPSPAVLFATSLVEWGALNKMSLSEVAPGTRSITPEICDELIDQLKLNTHDIESLPIGGIFSDGSFTPATVSPSALLTHPSRLLQIGHGGIAVVWTPPPFLLLTLPTRILHVSMPSEHLQRTTPNTLELLGQIILLFSISCHGLFQLTLLPPLTVNLWSHLYKKLKGIGVVHLDTPPKEFSMNQ
jgi:hypothetical protein